MKINSFGKWYSIFVLFRKQDMIRSVLRFEQGSSVALKTWFGSMKKKRSMKSFLEGLISE